MAGWATGAAGPLGWLLPTLLLACQGLQDAGATMCRARQGGFPF